MGLGTEASEVVSHRSRALAGPRACAANMSQDAALPAVDFQCHTPPTRSTPRTTLTGPGAGMGNGSGMGRWWLVCRGRGCARPQSAQKNDHCGGSSVGEMGGGLFLWLAKSSTSYCAPGIESRGRRLRVPSARWARSTCLEVEHQREVQDVVMKCTNRPSNGPPRYKRGWLCVRYEHDPGAEATSRKQKGNWSLHCRSPQGGPT